MRLPAGDTRVPTLLLPPRVSFSVWGTGQDQMRVVKQRLREMLPEARVFLDVDNLEEIGDLERYIDDSAAILVFCSAGYCESRNCMRELCHAVAKGVPLVALLEEAGRDGAPDEAGFRSALVAADARRVKWEMAVEPAGAALGDALFAQPALEWNRLGVFQDVEEVVGRAHGYICTAFSS